MSDREELLTVANAAAILGVSEARIKQLIQDRNRRITKKAAVSGEDIQLIGRKIGKRGTWILTKDEIEMIRPMANGRPRKKEVVLMVTAFSGEYIAHRFWFQDVLKGENVILCYTSALECLGLFSGYGNEQQIDVYALEKGKYENINYYVVDSFDGIETVRYGDLLCTSANQTINDMLADYNNVDAQSLVEGIGGYYYSHKESFDGLKILPQNMDQFNAIKDWAIEYWDEC